MATDEFEQLRATPIEQWLTTQASFAGKPPLTGAAEQPTGLIAEVRRLDERLRGVEERVTKNAEPAGASSVQVSPRPSWWRGSTFPRF